MNPKIATILAASLFLLAGVLFFVSGALNKKPSSFALGAAFAAISAVFFAKARAMNA